MRKLLLCILFIGSSIRPNYAQQTIGFIYSDTLAQDAYTLFAPFKSKSTYLIDVCGRKVNEWVSIYTPGAATYFTEEGLMVRAGLVPNLIFNGPGLGGAIEFFDWQGNVVRTIKASTNTYAQHHDFEVLPNGNVLVLVWELKSANEAIGMGRSSLTTDINGIWPEAILEYQLFPNDSEAVVWEWHVWDHLVQQFNDTLTNYDSIFQRPERINVNHLTPMAPPMDWLHINAIEYNADLDQIMLSSLVFNEIWIIDHSTTTAQSASSEDGIYGKGGDLLYRFGNPQAYNRGSSIDQHFFGQHNPTWIPQRRKDYGL
jgi:hypothetical protein